MTMINLAIPVEPVKPVIPLPETRFTASEMDLPYLAPPFVTVMDHAFIDNTIHKYKNTIHEVAVNRLTPQAGQSPEVNGQIGRFSAPNFNIPEILGGTILARTL